MQEKVWAVVKEHQLLKKGDGVLVACSGGADSVALLHLLASWREELALTLHVCHLDHGLRGVESRQDAEFVAHLAGRLQLPCTIRQEDVAALARREGLNIQEAGRLARYSFFTETASQHGLTAIATGHHADDQAETVLLHLIRGTGPGGLGGMAPRMGMLIRPLLEVTRAEIEAYCHQHGLDYRTDPSNFKTDYLRNRLRLQVIPLLREINPQVVRAINQTAVLLRDEDTYLEEHVSQLMAGLVRVPAGPHRVEIRWEQFNLLPAALQRRVIRWAHRQVGPGAGQLDFAAVERLRNQAAGRQAFRLQLPGGVEAATAGPWVVLRRVGGTATPGLRYRYTLSVPGETLLPEVGQVIACQWVSGDAMPSWCLPDEALLDGACLVQPLEVRNWLPGDRFYPIGMTGSKKLQDYFTDVKIPREFRDRVPVVTTGGEVAWVVGHRVDRRFAATPRSTQVLSLRLLDGDTVSF